MKKLKWSLRRPHGDGSPQLFQKLLIAKWQICCYNVGTTHSLMVILLLAGKVTCFCPALTWTATAWAKFEKEHQAGIDNEFLNWEGCAACLLAAITRNLLSLCQCVFTYFFLSCTTYIFTYPYSKWQLNTKVLLWKKKKKERLRLFTLMGSCIYKNEHI